MGAIVKQLPSTPELSATWKLDGRRSRHPSRSNEFVNGPDKMLDLRVDGKD